MFVKCIRCFCKITPRSKLGTKHLMWKYLKYLPLDMWTDIFYSGNILIFIAITPSLMRVIGVSILIGLLPLSLIRSQDLAWWRIRALLEQLTWSCWVYARFALINIQSWWPFASTAVGIRCRIHWVDFIWVFVELTSSFLGSEDFLQVARLGLLLHRSGSMIAIFRGWASACWWWHCRVIVHCVEIRPVLFTPDSCCSFTNCSFGVLRWKPRNVIIKFVPEVVSFTSCVPNAYPVFWKGISFNKSIVSLSIALRWLMMAFAPSLKTEYCAN